MAWLVGGGDSAWSLGRCPASFLELAPHPKHIHQQTNEAITSYFPNISILLSLCCVALSLEKLVALDL